MSLDQAQTETYLTVEQVAKRYNTSTDSIYRWKRDGRFPKAVHLSRGTTRWRLSELLAFEATLAVGFIVALDLPTSFFPEATK